MERLDLVPEGLQQNQHQQQGCLLVLVEVVRRRCPRPLPGAAHLELQVVLLAHWKKPMACAAVLAAGQLHCSKLQGPAWHPALGQCFCLCFSC
jgi:hypothetical protein